MQSDDAAPVIRLSRNSLAAETDDFLSVFFQFFEQLLFQVAARGLFYRAPLGGHRFLLRLTLSSRPSFNRLSKMRNLRTTPADVSLLWLCIGIHAETLALFIRD